MLELPELKISHSSFCRSRHCCYANNCSTVPVIQNILQFVPFSSFHTKLNGSGFKSGRRLKKLPRERSSDTTELTIKTQTESEEGFSTHQIHILGCNCSLTETSPVGEATLTEKKLCRDYRTGKMHSYLLSSHCKSIRIISKS